MHTNLFNPLRTYLLEQAPADLTPPGEQNPAPVSTPAEPPSTTSGNDNTTPAGPPSTTPGKDNTTPGEGEGQAPSFNLDAAPDTQPGDTTQQPDPHKEQTPDDNDAEYAVELPENFQASDDFKTLITQQAKAAGLDGKTAGQYVSGVIGAMQKAEQETIAQSTKTLKEEWGADFNANMGAVKQFTAKLRTKSGLTAEDLAPLQSPKGFKLLHALMTATSEDTFVGNKNASPGRSNVEEAKAMLTDPSHPDYPALDDPQHPRHMEANRKYNRLVGLS